MCITKGHFQLMVYSSSFIGKGGHIVMNSYSTTPTYVTPFLRSPNRYVSNVIGRGIELSRFFQTSLRHTIVTSPKQIGIKAM